MKLYKNLLWADGKCPCCKQDKDLTEHHVKEKGNRKIMVCLEYHRILEEYLKILAKLDLVNKPPKS